MFSSQCHNSLVFASRQIANNLSPIANKIWFLFLALRIISLKRTPNNLTWALQFFLCLFRALFMLILFCATQNRCFKPKFNLKRSQNWVIFAKKRKKFVFVFFFFWEPCSESQILTPHLCAPPFETFSLDALNREQKPSIKKNGRPGRSETGRENRDWFHL